MGRAFPTCYSKGSYWGPIPFLLYCMHPQETAFLALLGGLQAPPCPLEPRQQIICTKIKYTSMIEHSLTPMLVLNIQQLDCSI